MINSITPSYSNENKIQCLSIKHTKWPLWPDSEITQTRESLLQSLKPNIQLKHACHWESSVTWRNSPSLKNCCVNSILLKWKFWYWRTRALGSVLLWDCDGGFWQEIWLYKFRKWCFLSFFELYFIIWNIGVTIVQTLWSCWVISSQEGRVM